MFQTHNGKCKVTLKVSCIILTQNIILNGPINQMLFVNHIFHSMIFLLKCQNYFVYVVNECPLLVSSLPPCDWEMPDSWDPTQNRGSFSVAMQRWKLKDLGRVDHTSAQSCKPAGLQESCSLHPRGLAHINITILDQNLTNMKQLRHWPTQLITMTKLLLIEYSGMT